MHIGLGISLLKRSCCCGGQSTITCNDGMDIVFLVDYTASMGGAINGVKASIASIVEAIIAESSNNYRLGLILFDERTTLTDGYINYSTNAIYQSLPQAQKYINENLSIPLTQYITAMEVLSPGNQSSFTTNLNYLNTTSFPIGYGVGGSEPSDMGLDRVVNYDLAGAFRENVTKLVILITDNPSSGNDDITNATDVAFAQTLIEDCNAKGVKVLLMKSNGGPIEPLDTIATGTSGLISPSFTPQAIINAIQDICIVEGEVLVDNTVTSALSNPTLCINTELISITHETTGATGIGTATGLPTGVTASWSNGVITISGTPTTSGTFNYTIPLTGGYGTVFATGTITVVADNTVEAPSSIPTICIDTELVPITHTTTGATGIGTVTSLPAGVTASWVDNTVTISGTPSVTGSFNYSIPLTGGCNLIFATGSITVNANNTVTTASSTPTLCIDTALIPITHITTGATGIGTATGLPTEVTASWNNNVITISGTPSVSGTFNYSIPLTGGCSLVYATGSIVVAANNTVSPASSTPTLNVNTALTPITHTTTGATGIGTATGLPPEVTASWSSNTITVSGTPFQTGSFNYSIPLTGGCSLVYATGSIVVEGESQGPPEILFFPSEIVDTNGATILESNFGPLTILAKATSFQVNPVEDGYIIVEGDTIKTTTSGSRGHTLAVLNSAGLTVGSINTYDTFGETPTDSANNLAALTSALNSVQTGNYVVLVSWDACAVNQGLRDVLNNSFGGTETATWAPTRYSHVFIGRKV